jgi:Na+-transporting NADH:ubiquinone oxidoreductase subunit NqrD
MSAAILGGSYFTGGGRDAALLFISSLASSIFLVLLWIFDPLLALESSFFVFIVPVVFMAGGLYSRVISHDLPEILSQALAEALILGLVILGMALIREPLGFGSLSIPGMDVIRFIREEPVGFFQTASGALIILGYGIAVYRHFRNRHTNSGDD